jgi:hypothetical protein
MEDAPDRRGRRNCQALALEVPADGGGTRVETMGDKFGSEPDDPVAHGDRRPLRTDMRPSGSRFDRFKTTFAIPTKEPVQMAAADAALGCCGRDGQLS